MELATQLVVLAAATVIAAGAAFGMAWAFLEGAFRLMQPATRPTRRPRFELVDGTRATARGFARN